MKMLSIFLATSSSIRLNERLNAVMDWLIFVILSCKSSSPDVSFTPSTSSLILLTIWFSSAAFNESPAVNVFLNSLTAIIYPK